MAEKKVELGVKKLEKLLSNLRNDIIESLEPRFKSLETSLKTEMKLQESRFSTEIYRLEALIYSRFAGQASRGQSPWKFEVAPPSLGNSATAPDYAIFTDKDYGL